MGSKRPFRDSLSIHLQSKVILTSICFYYYTSFSTYNSVSNFIIVVVVCRNNGPDDVYIKVHYCGICHSDLHQIKNDLGMSNYPMVPGYVRALLTILLIMVVLCVVFFCLISVLCFFGCFVPDTKWLVRYWRWGQMLAGSELVK